MLAGSTAEIGAAVAEYPRQVALDTLWNFRGHGEEAGLVSGLSLSCRQLWSRDGALPSDREAALVTWAWPMTSGGGGCCHCRASHGAVSSGYDAPRPLVALRCSVAFGTNSNKLFFHCVLHRFILVR